MSVVSALLVLAFNFAIPAAEIPTVPDYEVGDVPDGDVVTPISLSIPDAEQTERLKERLAHNVVPIFRHCSAVTEQAQARMLADFAKQREQFRATMQKNYGKAVLNRATINHSTFARFVTEVRRQEARFPLPIDVAGAWALGESGDAIAQRWAVRLGRAMNGFICTEPVDETVRSAFEGEVALPKLGSVVGVTSLDAAVSLRSAEHNGSDAAITRFTALPQAREAMLESFAASERALGIYLSSFLQPNCLLDLGLTRERREQQLANATASRNYRPGDVVIRRGQAIDQIAKVALQRLEEERRKEERRLALVEARRELTYEFIHTVREQCVAILGVLRRAVEGSPWAVALVGCGGLLLAGLWRRKSQPPPQTEACVPATSYTVVINPDRKEPVLLPVQSSSEIVAVQAGPQCVLQSQEESAISGWREQVHEAERYAEELMAKVRAGLAPELAKQMMDRLVQRLLAQRSSLLATYAAAADRVAMLEQRFTAIHEQLQSQLALQEQRASDLEQKLVSKDRENSELLRAVVDAQKKLGRSQ